MCKVINKQGIEITINNTSMMGDMLVSILENSKITSKTKKIKEYFTVLENNFTDKKIIVKFNRIGL